MSSFEVTDSEVFKLWSDAKALLESAELDVVKGWKGNAAASTRARKAFRLVKKQLSAASKVSLAQDKERKASKKVDVVQ